LSNPNYRADIDGLRAVAVLSVVGYHAFGTLVPGGFIGVDVFFVISGYLICGIIFAQVSANTLSLREFYIRRINRIFPALCLVLACCLAAGWVYLFPGEFAELRRHVTAGALFYANYTLRGEAGYWDRASELKPLLHLWSLAVEEQFYIFFPLLAYVAARCRVNLFVMTVTIIAASFAMNVTRVDTSPLDSFYSPLRRIWELLLGGVIAQVQMAGGIGSRLAPLIARWNERRSRWAADVCSVVGAALILGGALLMSKNLLFPGYWALVPTIGAMLVIAAGREACVNRVFLSHKVSVWFGLLSYPLYLWHWPILSFLRILRGGETVWSERLQAVLLSVLLAWLTYRFLERPIRSQPRRWRPALALTPALLAVSLVAASDLLPSRSAIFGDELAKLTSSSPVLHSTPAAGLRMAGQRQTAVFVGDSHANQYQPRIARLISEEPDRTRSAIFFSTGSCLPIPNVKRASEPNRACEDEISLRQALSAIAATTDIDTVVLSAAWRGQFAFADLRYEEGGVTDYVATEQGLKRALASLEKMIVSLRREGRRVFIVLDNPTNTSHAFVNPHQLVVRHFSGRRSLRANVVKRQDVIDNHGLARTWLIDVAQRSGAIIIDPLDFLCDATTCPVLTEDGEPVYSDSNHLRPAYVRDRVTYLDDLMALAPDHTTDGQ
jgi:peptidoglycan/LPS O-acetylase OafA/YrhL